jgi:hypothetical protein
VSADLTFAELFTAHRVGDDPALSTEAICTALRLNRQARYALKNGIMEQCDHLIRATVRKFERCGKPSGAVARRSALMQSTFPLGDGTRVAWGQATVDDHRQRVAFLAAMRDGITNTIASHLDAVDAIEAAGVSCLDEIDLAAEVAA